MALYEFENSKGEKRAIVTSMKNNPPLCVEFTGPGNDDWKPAEEDGEHCWYRVHRLAGARVDPGGAIDWGSGKLPVSMTMPLTTEKGRVVTRFGQQVRELKNGAYATMEGRRIVDSSRSRDAHARETGMIVSRD